MKESLSGMVQQNEMEATAKEMTKFGEAQRVLALVTYINPENPNDHLAMDYSVILSRHDKGAEDIRNRAMLEWLGENADFFRLYYLQDVERKSEVLALNLNDKEACMLFLKKFKEFKRQLTEPS